jgi:ZIP family zinc transporter
MAAEGVKGWRTVFWAIVSGVPQILAAIPAYLAVRAFRPLLPYAFGFAAGAMLLLVMSEMIPESRSSARERLSSAIAAMGGFLFMMVFQLVFAH